MSVRDLAATAAANSGHRRAAADGIVSGDPSGNSRRFWTIVDGSAFSTNVWADKVIAYDAASQILDTRRAVGGLRPGPWAQRREIFEDLWVGGRAFVYGVVNVGGLGTVSYGAFCLVVSDPSEGSPTTLVVFPGNSAGRYTTTALLALEAAACDEATPWTDRADLVLVERASSLTSDSTRWPDLVCDGDVFFEVIIEPGPPVASIDEVRLRSAYLAALDRLRARAHAGDILSHPEQNLLAAYDAITAWHANGTRMEVA